MQISVWWFGCKVNIYHLCVVLCSRLRQRWMATILIVLGKRNSDWIFGNIDWKFGCRGNLWRGLPSYYDMKWVWTEYWKNYHIIALPKCGDRKCTKEHLKPRPETAKWQNNWFHQQKLSNAKLASSQITANKYHIIIHFQPRKKNAQTSRWHTHTHNNLNIVNRIAHFKFVDCIYLWKPALAQWPHEN